MSYFDTPEHEAAQAALNLDAAHRQLAEAQARYARAMEALAAAQAAAEAEIDQLNMELDES
ncbi:hypothetical protein [Nocardia rhizosphaerae]|uniref:Uncharacterized protein n=1 Tax=Nocardia rhizosphaerae TaxID=1691571 RepID=A0ABV8LEH6_9NOCA